MYTAFAYGAFTVGTESQKPCRAKLQSFHTEIIAERKSGRQAFYCLFCGGTVSMNSLELAY